MTSTTAAILIVDDTPENLTVLRTILASAGYRVRPALDGAVALRSAAAEPPDLVLLDVMMPGLDGFAVCRRLKAEPGTRDVPVLFISALDATASKVEGFAAGGLDYITKPFREEEVLARVRTHLALRAAQVRLAQQNEELQQAARLRDDVDRILRHDLRGPLGNLVGYAELIMADLGSDHPVTAHAHVIAHAGYALLDMIHGSFDLLKMERGAYPLAAEAFDVVAVVRQVVGELALAAGQRQVVADCANLSGPILVYGERLLTRSLCYNLVKNAVEASPPHGRVEFTCHQDAATTTLAVRNAGAVPEAIRERFFSKYLTQGKRGGSGLGAYSARLMAEVQRGSIRLVADEPGHATLVVSLPTAGEAEAAAWHATHTAGSARSGSAVPDLPAGDVLVADDDPASRAWLHRILPTPPIRLWFAADGQEALDALKTRTLGAALIDLEMPGLDGLATVTAYRAWLGTQPGTAAAPMLIALTGHQEPEVAARCRSVGFDHVLTKPVRPAELVALVGRALALTAPIVVDPQIRDLIPGFLASLPAQLDELSAAGSAGDLRRVRSLAHRLHGSLAMYGFHAASRQAAAIEAGAQVATPEHVHHLTAELAAHLAAVRIAPA
jgi:CheY-like chemotaxis protein/HPt (histidine-containing phosphotransfer) domain-containing protein